MKWADILWALTWPPAYTFVCAAYIHLRRRQAWRAAMRGWFGRWIAACVGVEVSGLASAYVPECGIGAVLAAGGVALWWWLRRKRRDKAPRMYGAKSRALVAALVRRAREAAKPRPALRPQPDGAA